MVAKLRIPPRFAKARLAALDADLFPMVLDYGKDLEKRVCRRIEGEATRGILLSGGNGVGKTHALASLTYAYATSDIPRRDYEFLTAPDIIDYMPAVGTVEDEYRGKTWTETLLNIPWLVIDDLGKEYRGGKLAEQVPFQIGRLLRARVQKNLVTHIATNLLPPQIKEVYGLSIYSLLKEAVDSYKIDGDDRRGER